MYHGLYRLRDYPSSPHEDVMEAWLILGKDRAVISHESALDLLGLSDVIPDAVHLIVPRGNRWFRRPPGAAVHTTHVLEPHDVWTREGMRVTSATRSILDSAQYGTGPEQIGMAVRQALRRELADRERLLERAQAYDRRVRRLIEQSVHQGVQ